MQNRNEPPVFGENGAVLNSETMTDEWRAEHDKNISFKLDEISWKSFWGALSFVPAYIFMIYILNTMTDAVPQYVALLAAIGAFTVALSISKAVTMALRAIKNFFFPSVGTPS